MRAAEESTPAVWSGFLLAFSLVGLLVLVGFGSALGSLAGLARISEASDLAGRQRMLGQRVVRFVLTAHIGGTAGFARLQAERSMRDLERDVARLAGPEFEPDEAAQLQLSRAQSRVRRVREAVDGALAAAGTAEFAAARQRLDEAIESQLDASEQLTLLLAREVDEERVFLEWLLGGLGLGVFVILAATLVGIARPLVEEVHGALERERRARTLAESALSARSRFVMNISHELRTPLNGILGKLNLLRGMVAAPEAGRHLADLQQSAERLRILVDDVLDLQSSERTGRREELDLVALTEEVVARFAPKARAKGLALELAVEPVLDGTVIGDPPRLASALGHLIDNAVRFTERGFVRVEVARVASDRVMLSVEDSGCGVPPIRAPRLFDAFDQGDDSAARRHDGAGLGLAVTRRLARIMGGDAAYAPADHGGSRFSFTAHLPPAAPVRRVLDGAGGAIVVGGHPTQTKSATQWLECWGYRVFRVDSAEELARVADWASSLDRAVDVVVGVAGAPPIDPSLAGSAPLIRVDTVDAAEGSELWTRDGLFARLAQRDGDGAEALRVLVVDDNPINLEVAAATLESMGCAVELAENGAEALERLATDGASFDLVLMDWHMPVMDGAEATRRIRTLDVGSEVPVVALTAGALDEARDACLGAGMNEVLGKPIELERLERVLSGLRRGKATDLSQP